MFKPSVAVLKFVGTISLGLLTGLSASATLLSLPTLLALPSSAHASQSFTRLRRSTATALRALAITSVGSYLLAFALSQPRGRHPYLLMVAGITSLGGLVDLISTNDNAAKILEGKSARTHEIELGQGREESSSSRGSSPRAGGSWEDIRATQVLKGKQAASDKDTPTESEDEDVNSEEIREGMDRWGFAMGVRAGVSALGFAMGVVGIWGDGY